MTTSYTIDINVSQYDSSIVESISTYLNTHKFIKHSNGNAFNYGLNSWGCDSIVEFNGVLWKFYAFQSNSSNVIYINHKGQRLIFNSFNIDFVMNRMEEVENTP